MDTDYSKLSQDDLIIKILEFVCKDKHRIISPSHIKGYLFPELDLHEITNIFNEIGIRKIPQISRFINQENLSIRYKDGLEDYIKIFKKMTKKKKLHRIVEFLSTNESQSKSSFDSGEIAKTFTPELSIYEINSLCEILIADGDVADVSDQESYAKNMMEVGVTLKTHTAYHTKKYLEEDEEFSIPIRQNIVTGNNISMIGGNNYGEVKQEDNSPTTKVPRKHKWWKIGLLILGGIASIAIILGFIFDIL